MNSKQSKQELQMCSYMGHPVVHIKVMHLEYNIMDREYPLSQLWFILLIFHGTLLCAFKLAEYVVICLSHMDN